MPTAFAADFPADKRPQGGGFGFEVSSLARSNAPPGFQPLWQTLERGPNPGFDQGQGGCEGRVYIQMPVIRQP